MLGPTAHRVQLASVMVGVSAAHGHEANFLLYLGIALLAASLVTLGAKAAARVELGRQVLQDEPSSALTDVIFVLTVGSIALLAAGASHRDSADYSIFKSGAYVLAMGLAALIFSKLTLSVDRFFRWMTD